jgi:hypothetical protein
VFASISPKADEKFELYFILKDIKRYFGFLFEKGFRIRDAHYAINPNGSWDVSLESQDCIMSIVQDRSEISIYFSPVFGSDNPADRFGLETMIYFLSQGQNYIGNFEGNLAWGKKKQFKRLADLLKEYIDQIAPCFGSNYLEHKDELRDREKQYRNVEWHKIREKWQLNRA